MGSIRARQREMVRFGAAAAWERGLGSPETRIAVLDSGVFAGHPDLGPILVGRFGAPGLGGPDPSEGDTHGTCCAGLAATAGHPDGLWGVAVGCSLLSARIGRSAGPFEIPTFEPRAIVRGLEWALANGASVLCMSWALREVPAYLVDAVREAARSAVLVAAVGNRSMGFFSPGFPANQPGVIGVGAWARDADVPFDTASRGVHVWAPGEGNLTTDFRDTDGGRIAGYRRFSGTSSASAMVAGAMAAWPRPQFAVTRSEPTTGD